MRALRIAYLLALLGCALVVTFRCSWQGTLTLNNHTWIVPLGQSPIWSPPPQPTYESFASAFAGSKEFPARTTPGLRIEREWEATWSALELLLCFWPLSLICGCLYFGLRERRQDLILHLAFAAAIGLVPGAIVCFSIWLLFGGWAPPNPLFFGILGLILGVVFGLRTFRRASAESQRTLDSLRVEHQLRYFQQLANSETRE